VNASCPRSFEVEALRDGRLSGVERASFERHLSTCAHCSREAQALDALGRALREREPPRPDELHVRRERTRLLAAFDSSLVSRESGGRGRRQLFALGAAAVLLAGVLVFWLRGSSSPALPAERAVVHADAAAVWSRRHDALRELVVLERGALWVHVAHAPGARPLLVLLPDGELEDTGTTFSVSVVEGRTTRVAVQEGSVILRLRGRAPVAIAAGQSFSPVSPAPLASQSASLDAPPPSLSAAAGPAAATPRASAAPQLASAAASRGAASDAFRTAVAALHRGESRDAAAKFAGFLERYPGDPRAEDAAYLRVLALRQSGDEGAMQSAARAYLLRYPNGFRRSEVEKLAGP
jgi:hypothetical protein